MFNCVSFTCLSEATSVPTLYSSSNWSLKSRTTYNSFSVGPREENLLKVSCTKVKRNMLPINKESNVEKNEPLDINTLHIKCKQNF